MPNKFTDYNFKPFINRALEKLNFTAPTEAQQRLLPPILHGQSGGGQAQTGSGKTDAFLLPIFNELDLQAHEVQAVITTPSRELAYQIYDAAKQIAAEADEEITVVNYVGGTDKKRQMTRLEKKQPQIVIGTPGRVLDLINSHDLDIHLTKY